LTAAAPDYIVSLGVSVLLLKRSHTASEILKNDHPGRADARQFTREATLQTTARGIYGEKEQKKLNEYIRSILSHSIYRDPHSREHRLCFVNAADHQDK